MTRRAAGRWLVVGALLAGVACGRDDPALPAPTAEDLAVRVQQVRTATVAGDRSAAGTALAGLRAAVAEHRAHGRMSEERAARVLAAAAEVESRLSLLPAPQPPPTTAPTRTTRPAGQRPAGDEEERGGKGEEKKEKEEED